VKNIKQKNTISIAKIDPSMNDPMFCQISGKGSMSSGITGYGLILRMVVSPVLRVALVKWQFHMHLGL
jgi:hypothetical protein